MAENNLRFFVDKLSAEATYCYTLQALEEYAAKQVRPVWPDTGTRSHGCTGAITRVPPDVQTQGAEGDGGGAAAFGAP